jgi:hypothetical protein
VSPRLTVSRVDTLALWTANLMAITVLPACLGRSGPSVINFVVYALVAGFLLAVIEDKRHLTRIFSRSDVRAYVEVRIALVALGSLGPYLGAGLLAKAA